ncbi:MAG: hypothetical protein IJ408_00090 [Clostridia bacterium]|nr:hypothetical protein [Clostridia bacterium]
MKTIHILNPAAGQGKAAEFKGLENAYITKGPGDAADYVHTFLTENDEDLHFKVYGGDGTVNEVVTGILRSGSNRASISVVPVGTGNDLLRAVTENNVKTLDVLTLNEHYAINAINTGFDLEVVQKAAEFKKKPLISGHLAYVLGVASVLLGKLGKKMKISYADENGNEDSFEGECLLVVAANGAYYGGGFKASPAADLSDGLIDLMIVKKVSKIKFLSLVAGYKKGIHIDSKTGKVNEKFKDFIIFSKCKSVRIEGIKEICADGEIFKTNIAKVGIIPSVLKIATEEKETANV